MEKGFREVQKVEIQILALSIKTSVLEHSFTILFYYNMGINFFG